jgi:hypothetical protein
MRLFEFSGFSMDSDWSSGGGDCGLKRASVEVVRGEECENLTSCFQSVNYSELPRCDGLLSLSFFVAFVV